MERLIKAVGGGARRARALSREEARQAMTWIAEGRAEPVQVGAFLLALRMKGEVADELAGFTDALSAFVSPVHCPAHALEVDAHGDGHRGSPSLLVAAACAAAAVGVPVCLSVERGSPFARHGLDGALAALGLDGALDPARAEADLRRAGVAACDLRTTCPPLHRLVSLRPLLGLRTAAQTVAKLVSPFTPAPRRLLGVFHAPYLKTTAAALAQLPGQGLVVQALGGLPEAQPGRAVRVADAGSSVRSIDLRPLALDGEPPAARAADTDVEAGGDGDGTGGRPDGAAATLAALAGEHPHAQRAAAAAALILHAATGADPLSAAAAALAALQGGAARAVANSLDSGGRRGSAQR